MVRVTGVRPGVGGNVVTEPIRLCVLSSQAIFRECLRRALGQVSRYDVVSVDRGEACLERMEQGCVDLILVDFTHPVRGLRRLLRQAKGEGGAVYVVLLGVDPSANGGDGRWVESGADALLPLDTSLEETVDVVDRVLAGEKIIPPKIAYVLFQRLAERSRQRKDLKRLQRMLLTPRELQILQLVSDHYSNADIASQLEISVHTVKNHMHNILEKLEVESRASAAELADENGWLDGCETSPVDLSGSPRGVPTDDASGRGGDSPGRNGDLETGSHRDAKAAGRESAVS